jgi:hypothetical protein
MRRTVVVMLGFWLAGAATAFAQGLPEGTFASTQDGCTKLEAKKMSELGDDFDFYVLTSKGLQGYEQVCDFVNVTAHNATSWVATAFCDEAGYTYPDMFSIFQKEEGKLAVTRLTDLTQSPFSSSSDSEASESEEQDQAEGTKESGESGKSGDQASDEGEQASSYVRCQNVKQ